NCTEQLKKRSINPEDVIVDYTGGTKTMTAALTLATIGQGYNFSYVGGKERTKDGLGIVVTGTEVVKTGVNPWQIYAVEEKKKISIFSESFQYEAAISIMESRINNLKAPDQKLWQGIMETFKGYLFWDNFNHKLAIKNLKEGLNILLDCEKLGIATKEISNYIEGVRNNYEILTDMSKKTEYFKNMHPILTVDLFSNAHRRAKQNKYDDAVARLYRTLEMVGQIAFKEKTGCSTSDVNPDILPETIREEYINRYRSPDDGKIRIPLLSTFRALKELNHPTGQKFFEKEEELKKILNARNNSILAHGLNPIKKETYEKLRGIIKDLFISGEMIEFPVLQW
ncbi:MAG: TIGR02710 family CRISPR-associated protein, partial [Nitrospirae bacterium]